MVSVPKKALQKILAMLMVKNVGQNTSVFRHSDQAENFFWGPQDTYYLDSIVKIRGPCKKIPKKVGE